MVALAHREYAAKDVTAGQMLRRLIADGYLDEHHIRKPRAQLRLPQSRRTAAARATTNLPVAS